MDTQRQMTDEEYRKAISHIVSSGRGYDALSDISREVAWRNDLFHKMYDEQNASMRAISKICNSTQSAQNKVRGIKALSEVKHD